MKIIKEDVLLHDPTDLCPGCSHAVGPEGAVRTGGHNAECRRRFAEIFKQDPAKRAFVEDSEKRKKAKEEKEISAKRTKIETRQAPTATVEPSSVNMPAACPTTNRNTPANPEPESAAAKRERAHDEIPVRPGEEEEDEPRVEEESVGKRRKMLRLGDRSIVLEWGCEGLRAMNEEECRKDIEEEWRWEMDQALNRMRIELDERKILLAMLHN